MTSDRKSFTNFSKTLINNVNLTCPEITQTIQRNRAKFAEEAWMTNGLIKSRNTKAKLTLKATKNPIHREKAKLYAKIYYRTIKAAKVRHVNQALDLHKTNIRQVWKITNSYLNRNKIHEEMPEAFQSDNKHISDKKQIADLFNNFFTDIGPKLAEKINYDKNAF